MLGEGLVFTRTARIRVSRPIVAGKKTYLAAGEYEAGISPHGAIARVIVKTGGVHFLYLTQNEFTEVTEASPWLEADPHLTEDDQW